MVKAIFFDIDGTLVSFKNHQIPKSTFDALYKLKDFVFNIPFVVGVVASFLTGIFVIKFLLEYLKKGSFKVFAIYRVIIGIAIIGLYISRM